jgi:16S rRNA (cytosine967-C5)-methyltransferase
VTRSHRNCWKNSSPEWNREVHYTLARKISLAAFPVEDIFPFKGELSDGIDALRFCESFLVQPHLFIRIRPRSRLTVLRKLERSKLPWKLLAEDCVQMNVSDKLEELFVIDKEVVIQDHNSQKVLDWLRNVNRKTSLLESGRATPLSMGLLRGKRWQVNFIVRHC